MSSPLHLPRRDNGDEDGIPVVELYKVAVEEYRFQADYNWRRAQALLTFNAGVFGVGAAVGARPGGAAALVFAFGVLASLACLLVVHQQHGYYRQTRDRLKRIEDHGDVPAWARFDTTAGMRPERRRASRVTVNRVLYGLFALVAAADLVGIVVVLR